MTVHAVGTESREATALERFKNQGTVLLTTFRRNGTPVATPVSIVVDGDHALIRTYRSAWKLKRLRRNPIAEVAPSTFRGKATDPAIRVHARILEGEESGHAARLLSRKYPFLHGVVVPLFHRLRHLQTVHLELTPVSDETHST